MATLLQDTNEAKRAEDTTEDEKGYEAGDDKDDAGAGFAV